MAGAVDLDDPQTLPPDALCRYADLVAAGTGRHRHRHAYAANLGVRASAYAAVGGFPPVAVRGGARAARAAAAGRSPGGRPDRRARPDQRARLHGRARGGLADLLLGLVHDSATGGGAVPAQPDAEVWTAAG